ncbi:2-polyprenyl-6-methoxyphenol hydroxylase-like FAD-dependent oxidoreductase [Herbihabitans rhizosphaerae]|uniref:2-polyprenyl-6-methoxyphenol hydroxylase-like FAD-dependent oxidoreductase n=1 Tax=Herbihabitans rhizosphaerae TaxID=1872711 RepID=A0A4Q7KG50_9PSEU|nr:FAD-dependent monooxygenase [Herbihabitans rhizosphaerae]RZS34049.1 2-polyprenyl-6-methoxyphenol hydroxylase-like FAD-dependent oxidoreductase [Herbihabitans rhizosphaerae]
MRAIVVGGGIGGLATAAALVRGGWDVEVLERADRFELVGSGISLWANGFTALDVLGIGDRLRAAGRFDGPAGLRDHRGRWLLRASDTMRARTKDLVGVVHRAELLDALLSVVPRECLRSGADVRAVRQDGRHVIVEHTGGTSQADVVIGADGLHSAVRAAVWPDAPKPRYTGQTAWRFVLPRPSGVADEGGEIWCRDGVFGFFPMTGDRIYAYTTANTPAGGDRDADQLARWREHCVGWPEPAGTLLATAREQDVLRHDLHYLPALRTYVDGRVALLGDAAHAMPPYLGQGGNQALEDAVTLAALLAGVLVDGVPGALREYDRIRRPRAQAIARQSIGVGRLNHLRNPVATRVRNALIRRVPESLATRSYASVVSWRPPAAAANLSAP